MKKNSLLLSSVFTSTSLFALMSMTPVLAQTADADKEADKPAAERTMKLGSITVTAQRREETVNEVPMAIQAFSGDQLDLLSRAAVECGEGDVVQDPFGEVEIPVCLPRLRDLRAESVDDGSAVL